MPATDLEKWKSKQIQAAVERGIHPLDAAKAMDEFLATLPVGADPATYIAPAYVLEEQLATEKVIDDARAAFYADVEPRYARLLDSGEAE